MKEISLEKLNEFYLYTLDNCSISLLSENDEEIGYAIFEEFEGNAIAYLNAESLGKLFKGGFMSKNKMNKSLELQKKVLEILDTDLWNLEAVKHSKVWEELMILSDDIKTMK